MAFNIQDLNTVDDNNQQNWPESPTYKVQQVNNSGRADEGMLARWFSDWNSSKTTTGTASAYTLTADTAPTAYYKGFRVRAFLHVTNNGAFTLNVSGLGANSVKLPDGTDPVAGTFQGGGVFSFCHDGGSSWIAENPWLGSENVVTGDFQTFTTSGTFDKSTLPSYTQFVTVWVVGGGGGGGGAPTTSAGQYSSSAGGSAGGFSIRRIDVASLGASETVTVGNGGNGGSGASNGATGGTSSFGAFCSATGGSGGAQKRTSSPGDTIRALAGGVGSGGDLNFRGQTGGLGIIGADSDGSPGGNSFLAGGANGTTNNQDGINADANSGAGGSGCTNGASQGTARTGGNGGSGIVIVWY